MTNTGPFVSRFGLDTLGLEPRGTVHWNQSPAELYEHAIRRGEAQLAAEGPLVANTGSHTGRSPNDKFMVEEPTSQGDIWWGSVNRPIAAERFNALRARVFEHLAARDELFVFDGFAGADPKYRLKVRVINENAWQNLFARNMFVRATDASVLVDHEPEFTVINAPSFEADPERDGTQSSTFILVDIGQRQVLIGGTQYAGEIKKSIFTVMNYLLPKRDVMSMHCSANYGADRDDVALFFGLSGTGKTTLSADSSRTLIGDDEHGWSDHGVFNIEGGCYAKVIRLDPKGEPDIFATTRTFGTILENVVLDESRTPDLDDDRFTENTRSSYPISQLSNVDEGGCAGHPKNVVFLTCDAFGVLPPISRLDEAQAMYHFLSGYTAKVAGTERGVTEPQATFSTCFGAPFMPLHPGVYAELLGRNIAEHGAKVWLVNTGWTGGPHGVGNRMKLSYTRRMVNAALAGELDDVSTQSDPIFGVAIPESIEGVPDEILVPRNTWQDGAAFDATAAKLARMFVDNFEQFAEGVSDDVKGAAPKA